MSCWANHQAEESSHSLKWSIQLVVLAGNVHEGQRGYYEEAAQDHLWFMN